MATGGSVADEISPCPAGATTLRSLENSDMGPKDIDRWIDGHQNDTDAQLQAIVASKDKLCLDYRAALELLDRRAKSQRAYDLELAEMRHRELSDRLAALEKPHWTTTPVFWVTALGAVAALLAAIFAYPAFHEWLSVGRVGPVDGGSTAPALLLPSNDQQTRPQEQSTKVPEK